MGKSSTPTKAAPFGAVRTLTLPISKVKVLVRKPSMFSLVASGGIPGELTSLVWRLFGTQGATLNELLQKEEEIKSYSMLVEKFVPHVLASVKVGDASDCQLDDKGVLRGTVALIDLSDIDKNQLFLYGVGVVRSDEEIGEVVAGDLETFRQGPARPDGGPGGEAVRAAAEPAPGA